MTDVKCEVNEGCIWLEEPTGDNKLENSKKKDKDYRILKSSEFQNVDVPRYICRSNLNMWKKVTTGTWFFTIYKDWRHEFQVMFASDDNNSTYP